MQSTCLLAFFAGYVVLFVFSRSVLNDEFVENHQEFVSKTRGDLLRGGRELLPVSSAKTNINLLKDGVISEPVIYRDQDKRVWIRSVSPFRLEGADIFLDIAQDVTSVYMHHQKFFAFMIFAGAISVFCSAILFRIILWRGLSMPLSILAGQIDELELDSLGLKSIDNDLHPAEFKHIIQSFNALQARLASSWHRERCFVDGVAHELRTPITILSTNSQRLLADVSDESKPAVQLLLLESQRLADLLSVMLDFARVDAGRIVLSPDLFDPELLCVEAFERLQCLSPDRIRLCEPVDKVFPKIFVDEKRFHQCMAALVENALRYTHGYVDLSLTIAEDHVVFHVLDYGSGIPEGEREVVVTRFARGTTSIGTRGSGIGLAVVHEFMLLMGGRLSICDSLQGGADIRLMFNF